jgi:hypothetical protein
MQAAICDASSLLELENAMTLQIGLITAEGFVIASDRLVQNRASDRSAIHSGMTNKIQIFDAPGLVVAYAGHNPPTAFGYGLRDAWAAPFDETIVRYAQQWFRQHPTPHPNQELEIIIGHQEAGVLWHVVGKSADSEVIAYSDKISTRNTMSLAPFMAEHFYTSAMSLPEIELLAALTIWYGERQGNTTIRGLDGVTCQNGRLSEWDAAKIATLKAKCGKLHDGIRGLIASAISSTAL